MPITTTLNAIRAHHPCESGWRKLLATLGKTTADDEPLPLLAILDSNGLADALWCLRVLGPEHHRWIVSLACDFAEHALRFVPLGEDRPRRAIETTRAWLRGEATLDQVRAAAAAAYTASSYAAPFSAAYAAYAAYLGADAAASAVRVIAIRDATYAAQGAGAAYAERAAQEAILRAALANYRD